jgi:hypothetical protein
MWPYLRTTSNAVVSLTTRVSALDTQPTNITISEDGLYNMNFDYVLSSESDSSARKVTINANVTCVGDGHALIFARNSENVFIVADNKTVVLTNMVLKNFSDAAVQLGTGSHLIFGDGVRVEVAENQTLSNDWEFQGNALVVGYGNRIDLGAANMTIANHGYLALQDISVAGLKRNNLRCVGDDASITWRNSNVVLSHSYTLTCGAMQFEQDVVMTGTNAFNYETTRESSIASNSTLFFDAGTIFNYAPDTDNRDLLAMEDKTSRLFLNGCTLTMSTTGMRLTTGSLFIDHNVAVYNDDASALSEGFGIGNGVDDDRVNVQFMPAATLDMKSGIIDLNN